MVVPHMKPPRSLFRSEDITVTRHEVASFDGLPSAYIETAEFDCLRDEGAIFVQRLQDAGVETSYIATKGTMHGFDMAQKSDITLAQIEARCKWLE